LCYSFSLTEQHKSRTTVAYKKQLLGPTLAVSGRWYQ